MNLDFQPFVRYVAKTKYYLKRTVSAYDCRMLYVISGKGRLESMEKSWTLMPNALIYYPAGIPYRIYSDSSDLMFYSVNFDFNQNNSDVTSVLSPITIREFKKDEAIFSYKGYSPFFAEIQYFKSATWAESIIKAIMQETLDMGYAHNEIKSSFMRILLIKMLRGTEEKKDLICEQARDIIENNLSWNNIKIAAEIGYHPYYLNEKFKKENGISLHQYIIQRRLAKGYEMITASNFSIEEIAHLCGFSSQSYFTKMFSERYNITPLELRRNN